MEKTISPAHAGNAKKGKLILALVLGLYSASGASSSGGSSSTGSSSPASSSGSTTSTSGYGSYGYRRSGSDDDASFSIFDVVSITQLISIVLILAIAIEMSITACVMKGYWRVEVKGIPEVPDSSRPSAPSAVTLTPSGANEILNFLKEDTFVVFQTSKEACEAAVEIIMHNETQQSVPHSAVHHNQFHLHITSTMLSTQG